MSPKKKYKDITFLQKKNKTETPIKKSKTTKKTQKPLGGGRQGATWRGVTRQFLRSFVWFFYFFLVSLLCFFWGFIFILFLFFSEPPFSMGPPSGGFPSFQGPPVIPVSFNLCTLFFSSDSLYRYDTLLRIEIVQSPHDAPWPIINWGKGKKCALLFVFLPPYLIFLFFSRTYDFVKKIKCQQKPTKKKNTKNILGEHQKKNALALVFPSTINFLS